MSVSHSQDGYEMPPLWRKSAPTASAVLPRSHSHDEAMGSSGSGKNTFRKSRKKAANVSSASPVNTRTAERTFAQSRF
jgi:hypothetical protein